MTVNQWKLHDHDAELASWRTILGPAQDRREGNQGRPRYNGPWVLEDFACGRSLMSRSSWVQSRPRFSAMLLHSCRIWLAGKNPRMIQRHGDRGVRQSVARAEAGGNTDRGESILDPKVDPPTVTAALAGTVHAIYCELECLVELEFDRNETSEPGETSIRQMVLEAVAELNYWKEVNDARGPGDKLIKPLSAKSKNREKWNDLIEVLREEVLADYDFEMDGEIGDMDPDRGEELKEFMGIKADYFVAVVEDPGPERLAQIREEIRQLLY